jgi:hypothetical protein
VLAVLGPAGIALAATTPNFNNNNEANPSVLFGDHDVDASVGVPPHTVSSLPTAGTIPGTPALMSPFGSGGNTISVAGGSSKAKGGAGHTEGSNLAKITFPTGMGIDQIDGAPHDVGPSVFTLSFNFKWDLPGPGTLGPPMSGTFNVPIAAKVGTGPGAFAKFEWDINWDAVVNGAYFNDVRTQWTGTHTFTGAGTHTMTFTAPASPFSPSSIGTGGGDDRLIVHGAVRFIANNDDSRSLIETLGPAFDELDPELRNDPFIIQQYQLDPSLNDVPSAGFEEEIIPEPSSAILGGAVLLPMILRRRNRAARP